MKQRLRDLISQIEEAAVSVGRNPDEITLVAVSKLHSYDRIIEGMQCGIVHFGENRIQEAENKIPQVLSSLLHRDNGLDDRRIMWHLVGRLQSNKAVKAAGLFDYVHSLDKIKTARHLSKGAVDLGRVISVFIQVNTTQEETKGGVEPDEVIDFASEIVELEGLKLIGLMTMGPLTDDEMLIRKSFRKMVEISHKLRNHSDKFEGVKELSMGMSDDFKVAIQEGATYIRIGTAIFGERT